MGAAEAPKSEQIQANVAAALSRLRGELGAASSPIAGTAQNMVPKTPSEPVGPTLNPPLNFPVTPLNPASLGPLPAGPVRPMDIERTATVVRPFEPTIAAAMMPQAAHNEDTPPVEPELLSMAGRREPSLSAEHAARAEADLQPDLLSGMEVPPAPPPPLAAFESEDEVGGRGKRMRNRLLVLLVLVAIVGAGSWGYILKHHIGGPVPVISADSTPEKVKPTDEGGMQVPNQNVQILDNMNGQSTAQNQDTVLPAPEQPLAPPTADTSNSATTQSAGAAAANTTSTTAAADAPTVTDQPSAPVVPAPAIPNASTPAPSMPAVTAPATTQSAQASNTDSNGKLTLVAPQTQQAVPQPSSSTTAAAPAQPAETPKPAAAPATTQTAEAPSAPAPTPTISSGSARVQLAAVKSVALAKAQWAKLQKAYPDLLGALTLNVEKVERNGGTLYRIQAGPLSDKAAAKDLCTKLAAQKQACLVPK